MNYIIVLVIGIVIGGVGVYLVFRNNPALKTAVDAETTAITADIKADTAAIATDVKTIKTDVKDIKDIKVTKGVKKP
jgi:hypothetical protein